MKILRLILILQLSIFCSFITEAQDIHFTQYTMSPLDLNPAHTGDFEGTFRIGGIYRDQWFGIGAGIFRTPAIYIDSPIMKGFGKKTKDWIGLGLRVLNDQGGRGKLANTNAMLSAAYHKALDKKRNKVFSFGIQGGINQRRIDTNLGMNRFTGLTFGDQFNEQNLSADLMATGELLNDNITYYDFSGGVMYNARIDKKTGINFGLNVRHVTTPQNSLIDSLSNAESDSTNSIPLRFLVHVEYDKQLNDKLTFNPRALYQRVRGGNQELQVQALLHYLLNKQNDVSLNFGLGYRFSGAGELLAGLDYKDLRFGASYDLNVTGLSAGPVEGAIEVGLSYIVKIFKKPVVKPVIICPKL